MPTIELSTGIIPHRVLGPADDRAPVAVLVHGALVDSRLWDGVAGRLADHGVRCVLPDLPLGSHRTPCPPGADRSPRGVARVLGELLEALDLHDVTLVGSDTGGALCQLLLAERPERVGRVVLTNCDAFDVFPPFPFSVVFRLARTPAGTRLLLAPMGARLLRHSPLGYGLLARDLDPALTADWLVPLRTDAGVRDDFSALVRAMDPRELEAATERMAGVDLPVQVVWGMADRAFKPALGRRLAERFPQGRFVEVPGARTFVALDEPDAVVAAVLGQDG